MSRFDRVLDAFILSQIVTIGVLLVCLEVCGLAYLVWWVAS